MTNVKKWLRKLRCYNFFRNIYRQLWGGVFLQEIRNRKIYGDLKKKLNVKFKHNPFLFTDKTRYIVLTGVGMEKTGLFCYMAAFNRWIRFAEKHSLIPIVDMKNISNQYLYENEIGKKNAWEYYFEQPGKVDLEDAYSSGECLVVNNLCTPPDFPAESQKEFVRITEEDYINDSRLRKEYQELYKKYFRLNQDTCGYIDNYWEGFQIKPEEKVLGLLCRGSDYYILKPYAHNIQPTPEQITEKVREFMKEERVDHIFVATEDQNILDTLIDEFGEKVLYVCCERIKTYKNELVAESFDNSKVSKYKRGLDYVTSIYLLSKCDYLIASRTQATSFCFLMRNKPFEYEYIWQLGYYGQTIEEHKGMW